MGKKKRNSQKHQLVCLSFIFWSRKGKLKKTIEYYLDPDNRITIYNYISEVKSFLAELAKVTNVTLTISYDYETKEYFLEEESK